MRRIVLLVAVMGAMVALSAGAALSEAETETVTARSEFVGVTTNPCNGELIPIVGEQTTVFHFTANDNSLVFVDHVSLHGTGLGTITGAEYVFNFDGQLAHTFHVGETISMPFHTNVIAQGPVPDFLQHGIIHFTVNHNGEVTSTVVFSDEKCKG